MTELWVFGYGSLIWRPGFPYVEAGRAPDRRASRALRLFLGASGDARANPGLVLGLDRGGTCRGVAFRVAPEEREGVLAYLRTREQVTAVYRERLRPVLLSDGRRTPAIAYLVDRNHPQYAGKLDEETQFQIVANAAGQSGHQPRLCRQHRRASRPSSACRTPRSTASPTGSG